MRVAHAPGIPWTFSRSKLLVNDPGMHHSTCVTHVLWSLSGWLNCGGEESVPGIPGAWANRSFRYLGRGLWYSWAILVVIIAPSDSMWWHRSGITLAQVMACRVVEASHSLQQCWIARLRIFSLKLQIRHVDQLQWYKPLINFQNYTDILRISNLIDSRFCGITQEMMNMDPVLVNAACLKIAHGGCPHNVSLNSGQWLSRNKLLVSTKSTGTILSMCPAKNGCAM